MKLRLAAMGFATLASVLLLPATSNASPTYTTPGAPIYGSTVINADDLVQPRGLNFDSHGQLWVVEAGAGGGSKCITVDGPRGPEQQCLNPTGGHLTLISNNSAIRVKDLPSIAGTTGDEATEATGPVDVVIREDDSKVVVMGGVGTPALRKQLGKDGELFGRVIRISNTGKVTKGVDLMSYENKNNLDLGNIDSNPYSIVLDGSKAWVADAGANVVYKINDKGMGKVNSSIVFGSRQVQDPFAPAGVLIPMESVPNTVARGSDGTIYFGELTGFPFQFESARVMKESNGSYVPVAEGFTNIIDIAVDATNNIYVLEYDKVGLNISESFNNGRLTKVAPNGTKTVLADGLRQPGGVALNGGYAYVTTCSVCVDGTAIERYDA